MKVKTGSSAGWTLIEIVTVVAILSVLSLLSVNHVSGMMNRAKITAAERDLATLRNAFMDEETGYLRDMRGIPGFSLGYLRIANLLISTNLYGAVTDGSEREIGFRVDDPRNIPPIGCAAAEVFRRWDGEAQRGWNGPYVKHATGTFPFSGDVRFSGDPDSSSRGFYPSLRNLRLPEDFISSRDDCSIYGFPGEPAVIDPWGNPYVLQIPPPQAFPEADTNVSAETRFHFARVVSAGPDGRLDTPCFSDNGTNRWATSWTEERRRKSRQAGLYGTDAAERGDDIVLFLSRNDIDEGSDEE